MSYSTGGLPKATTDAYDQPGSVTLKCWGATGALVIVTNQAVAIQIAEGGGRPDSAPSWQDEFYAPPGAYPIDAGDSTIDAIRVRSATPGKPANVAIAAFA
jgi:hypothetical protein